MREMYGYDVPSGHRGRLPDGTWMLFPTRKEYEELWRELTLQESAPVVTRLQQAG